MSDERIRLEGDWYGLGVPAGIELGDHVYIDTSYSVALFLADHDGALVVGSCTGIYDRANVVAGREGTISFGSFTHVNGANVIAADHVTIGDHVLLAWGAVITDSLCGPGTSIGERREALVRAAADPDHPLPHVGRPAPVVIEDNVWVGFDAVVGPGVRIGHGAVVGSRSIVLSDVSPYTVVAGDPARTLSTLDPDDTSSARQLAIEELRRDMPDDLTSGSHRGGTWLTGDVGDRSPR